MQLIRGSLPVFEDMGGCPSASDQNMAPAGRARWRPIQVGVNGQKIFFP
jgi:hypothetical protein